MASFATQMGGSVALLCLTAAISPAQQISTSSGLQANGTRFGESFQSRWSYNRPGISATFNGGGGIPFGGSPGNPGIAMRFNAGGFQGNFSAGQFSSTNSTSMTPVLATTNGYPGSLFIGTTRPFVIGYQPVIGTALPNLGPANTVAGRMARGEFRVQGGRIIPAGESEPADLPPLPAAAGPEKTPREQPTCTTAVDLIARGDAARSSGKTALARVYYQLAAARTEESASLLALERLRDAASQPDDN